MAARRQQSTGSNKKRLKFNNDEVGRKLEVLVQGAGDDDDEVDHDAGVDDIFWVFGGDRSLLFLLKL